METSLIGKALGFGSNEYGFEPRVSNINISYTYGYAINHVSMAAAHKTIKAVALYSRKTLALYKVLFRLGALHNYHIYLDQNNKKYIAVYPAFYKKIPLIKNLRLISTPSNAIYVSVKALKLILCRSGGSSFLIDTSHGILTHSEAINQNVGGVLLACYLS